jgi:hypothetical protein
MGQLDTLLNCVLLVVGPCAFVYSVVSMMQTKAFIRRSVEVNGEVVRLERSQDRGRYGYTYAPVFSFTSMDWMAHLVASDVGSSPAGFDVGDSVRVRYDPANPETARIHSFFQTWGTAFHRSRRGSFHLFRLPCLWISASCWKILGWKIARIFAIWRRLRAFPTGKGGVPQAG